MVKSKQVRKMLLKIPRYVPDATLDLSLVGINVVITDNYNVSSPITIVDKTFVVSSLVYDSISDKYEVLLETELDVESGLLFKYRYVMDKLSAPTNNPDFYTYTSFSVPTSFYGNQNGLKVEGMLVLTPSLSVEEKVGTLSGDLLIVNGSEFLMPLGTSKHKYTNWKVYEVNDTNNVIYSRKDDNVNLTTLKLPLSKFENTKLYVIECSYLSDDNVESLTARYYYNRTRRVKDNIKIEPILPFSENNDMYYNVACNVLNAKYINIIIKEKTGNNEIVISTYRNLPVDVYIKLTPNGLKPGLVYNVYYYLTITESGTDVNTSEEFIHSFTYVDNNYYNDAKVNYPEKYDAMYPLQTGNFRCVSYQLKNGTFLLGKNLDNKLSLFIKDGDAVRDTGVSVELPYYNDKGFPDFTALQLSNGRVMINYAIYMGSFRRSCWALYDVNLSTNEFTLVDSVVYSDEYLSCGHNGSAVVVGDDVYYIPHRMVVNGAYSDYLQDDVCLKLTADGLQPNGDWKTADNLITFVKDGTGTVTVDPDDARLIKISSKTDKVILKASVSDLFVDTPKLSIQFILKIESTLNTLYPYFSGVVGDHSNVSNYRFGFNLKSDLTKILKVGAVDGAGSELALNSALAKNTTYLVTMVYGESNLSVYVDGQLMATVNKSGDYDFNAVDVLTLGNKIDNLGTGTYSIGELMVYKRELTAEDIERNYNIFRYGYYIPNTVMDSKLEVSLDNQTVTMKTVDVPEDKDVLVPMEIQTTGFDKTLAKITIPKLWTKGLDVPLRLYKLSYNGSFTRETLVERINEKVLEGYTLTYKNGNLYILGGYDADRTYIFPDVLKYNIEDRTLETLCLLNNTSNYSRKNAVSVFTRPDGKVIMFNNSLDGGDVNDCSTVLLDISKAGQNTFATIQNNDMRVNVPFLSTVVLRDGGYIRLSYNDQTLKHVLYYPATPLLSYDDYDATVSSTLIVRRNEVIKVMDLHRYSKIVIEGDSLDNTGKLIFEDEFCTREFDYRTKFVTRSETQSQVDERNEDKEHIFILQGVNYEVDV